MKKHAVVIIPTYNERDTIIPLLRAVEKQRMRLSKKNITLSMLVVDDSSPDGTGSLVETYKQKNKHVHLLTGKKEGLGAAYLRGFDYAQKKLAADIVVQMDADFSHDPNDIPRLIEELSPTTQYVIGSRYVEGGSIPHEWPKYRVLISSLGNAVARYIAGLAPVKDCTGGFKAISATLLAKIPLAKMKTKGYAFQMSLLSLAQRAKTGIKEIPIHFIDRTFGTSKMRMFDMVEFVVQAIQIRYAGFTRLHTFMAKNKTGIFVALGTVLFVGSIASVLTGAVAFRTLALYLFLILSIAITAQSLFTLVGMMYAWDEPERIEKNRSPKEFTKPQHSFTAIIPALHEENVIAETIRAVSAIDYPEELKEVIVVCRSDDNATIVSARHEIATLNKKNIRLVVPDFTPRNKPDKLNYALKFASNEVVCVFDAEDAPHHDIYNVVNTVMIRDNADVVQSGVQLINFRSNWFSTLNVLEYFFWFKSVLHYVAEQQVIPLGGNTVFFKKEWIEKVNGWDADCLTEDADVGIKLSSAGANMRVIYDEVHATQEETPPTLSSFIKQRTRWNQGFIQVFRKQDWKKLPKFSQRFLVGYLLIWPEMQAFLFLYVALSLLMIFTVKLPILMALISMLPLYILIMHFVILNIGLHEFTRKYNIKYPLWMPLKLAVTFIPFQLVLGYSALRAVYRDRKNNNTWEKTEHLNAHRPLESQPQPFSL